MGINRICVIVTSAVSAVACSLSIYFLVVAFCKYRAEDFYIATTTDNFESFKTCVESISSDQLKGSGFADEDRECDKGRKNMFNHSLLASVHGLYFTYAEAKVRTYTMRRTVETVLTAVAAKDDASALKLVPLNFTTIYEALNEVAQQPLPQTCREIYPTASYDWAYHSRTLYRDSVTQERCAVLDDTARAAAATCVAAFPIEELPVVCDVTVADAGEYDRIATQANGMLSLTQTQLNRLYTHCEDQFRFQSSGTVVGSGAFGIPIVGVSPDPIFTPWVPALGYNSSTDYTTRTKINIGLRFGTSAWAYVPMIMAAAFLMADAVIFFVAEVSATARYATTSDESDGNVVQRVRDSLVMQSTTSAVRKIRFAFGAAAFLGALVFYVVFALAPWGFGETKLKRPVCETGKPDHEFNPIGLQGTVGGWKADYDAQSYELLSISFIGIVLILLPWSTTGCCGLNAVFEETSKRKVGEGPTAPKGKVAIYKALKMQQRGLFLVLLIGAVVAVVGQAVASFQFGYSWAEGVLGAADHAHLFNPKVLFEKVFDQLIATLAITLLSGLIIGLAAARWTINGASCATSLVFGVWLAFLALCLLPLFVYAERSAIFDREAAYETCNLYVDEGLGVPTTICRARYWTLLAGGALMGVLLLFITAHGLYECARAARNSPTETVQRMEPDELAIVRGVNPSMQIVPVSASGRQDLSGYHSRRQGFYNFPTTTGTKSPSEELRALLRAPRTAPLVFGRR